MKPETKNSEKIKETGEVNKEKAKETAKGKASKNAKESPKEKPQKKAPKRAGGNIGRRILLVVVGAMIGLRLYMWNANGLLGNALPMPFGYGASVILSGSMEPTLSVDDLAILKEVDEISVGDIVVFEDKSSLVIHRVVAVSDEVIVTQGDANNTTDEPIAASDVKAKLIGKIPFIGKIVRILKQPVVLILLLMLSLWLTERSYRAQKSRGSEEIERIKEEIRRLKEEGHE